MAEGMPIHRHPAREACRPLRSDGETCVLAPEPAHNQTVRQDLDDSYMFPGINEGIDTFCDVFLNKCS